MFTKAGYWICYKFNRFSLYFRDMVNKNLIPIILLTGDRQLSVRRPTQHSSMTLRGDIQTAVRRSSDRQPEYRRAKDVSLPVPIIPKQLQARTSERIISGATLAREEEKEGYAVGHDTARRNETKRESKRGGDYRIGRSSIQAKREGLMAQAGHTVAINRRTARNYRLATCEIWRSHKSESTSPRASVGYVDWSPLPASLVLSRSPSHLYTDAWTCPPSSRVSRSPENTPRTLLYTFQLGVQRPFITCAPGKARSIT